MFSQAFWDVVKDDLVRMFNSWFEGDLDLFGFNFAMITLIPKENDAKTMEKFRPISLLNCCFKIFTKVLTNRLALIIGRLIFEFQSAFVRGRYILESVVTAHEIVHVVHSSRRQGLVFKIDYDKVNLKFLLELLALRGFGPRWLGWIKSTTMGGSVGVKLNGEESDFFLTGKGLIQGDPLAPLLFNLVVDVFSRMLVKVPKLG